MPVAGHALVKDLSGGHVQRREQGRGAVPLVVEGHGPGSAFLEGQTRLRAVERLYLALLIEGEDDGSFGRIHVEAHYVPEFLDEVRILRQLEVVDAVRLQAMGLPDPSDGGLMQFHFLRHDAAAPVGAGGGVVLEYLADDLRLQLGCDLPGPAGAWPFTQKSGDAARLVAVQPPSDGRPGDSPRRRSGCRRSRWPRRARSWPARPHAGAWYESGRCARASRGHPGAGAYVG